MKFPKVGDCVLFTKDYVLQEGLNHIKKGTLLEVLKTEVGHHYLDLGSYWLSLGMENGKIVNFNFTEHMDYIRILPNTEAAEVLFGGK